MILILTYAAVLVFAAGLIWRGLRIKTMPVHLRWELAPVPHEKGKASYGGSYLEEFEWWTQPREKSLLNEALYMGQEILLLKGVWEHNRSLWVWSFPMHLGLYLLVATIGCLVLASLGLSFFGQLAQWTGGVGYVSGAVGALGLLGKRMFDPKIRPFAAPSSYFNLVFLAALFASGGLALAAGGYLSGATSFVKAFFTANTSVSLSAPLSAHIGISMLFLLYLPFTYMMHFVAKYFTYHEIRWNDEPIRESVAMQEEVKALLGQPVTWAAPHLGADGKKNWVDIATSDLPEEEK
jgi:nitrate reductase gamma subunit